MLWKSDISLRKMIQSGWAHNFYLRMAKVKLEDDIGK